MLHFKTSLSARISIPKDGLTVFTTYPSLPKNQALEDTVPTLFHPVVHSCFQPIGVIIENTVAPHNVVKG